MPRIKLVLEIQILSANSESIAITGTRLRPGLRRAGKQGVRSYALAMAEARS